MKNKKIEMLKASNGITLIALVITIIVLLILAGISIMMLTGDNGILVRAGEAKEQNSIAQIQEQINLAYHSALVDGQGKVTDTALENELKKEFNKTDLGEDWLDTTSIAGKWIITIDNVTLEVSEGIMQDIEDTPKEKPISDPLPIDGGWNMYEPPTTYSCSLTINENSGRDIYFESGATWYSLSQTDTDFEIVNSYVQYSNGKYVYFQNNKVQSTDSINNNGMYYLDN